MAAIKSRFKSSFCLKRSLLIVAALFWGATTWAQTTYYSRASGSWNANSTWSTVGFGSSTNAGTFPVAGDVVLIGGGRTVTVNVAAACASINFDAGTSVTNTITINPGIALNVSGSIVIPQTITTGTNRFLVNAGLLTAGNIDFTTSIGGAAHELSVSTGQVTVSGNISSGGTAVVSLTDAGTLAVGGSFFPVGQGTLSTAAGSIFQYNGGGAQNIEVHTYANLRVSGGDTKTFAGLTGLVNENLLVDINTTLAIPGITLTVNGTTQIDGTVTFTSNVGTKRFVGLVSVAGTWSNPANESVVFNGGITNTGSFNVGTGTCTFSTNSQVLTGNFTLRNVTVTGAAVEVTNTNSLTVIGNLTGTGKLVQGPGAVLNLRAGATITGLDATATNNLVHYDRASAQTVKGVDYYHLTLSGSGLKTLQQTTTTIAGDFTLAGTASAVGVTPLTIGGNFTTAASNMFSAGGFRHVITGNWNNLGMFNADGGTIEMAGTNQQITGNATTFDNLHFSGTGIKSVLVQATMSGELLIDAGAVVDLGGINTHQANTLVLNGVLQSATGTWGAAGSGAANIDNTFFSGTGIVNILAGGRTFYSRADGNWLNTNTWSTSGFAGPAAAFLPAATDLVVIGGGRSVLVDGAAFAKDIRFDPGTSVTNTLSINAGQTLNVVNTITLPQTVTAGANLLAVDAGNLLVENIDFVATASGAGHELRISTGTATVSGNVSGAGLSSTVSLTGSGALEVAGAFFTNTEGTLVASAGSSMVYNGTATQIVQAHSYANLQISGSGKTMALADHVMSENLIINAGAGLTVPGVNMTVNGLTQIDGSITFSSTTGAKIFAGLVTITGTWSSTSEAFTFRGGITNAGTFTAGSGTYSFGVNPQALTGTFTFRNVSVTGIDLTNNNSLTVTVGLSGTGRLIQADGATLTIGGTSAITNLTATATGNTVNYTGAAQTVKPVNYFNLGLSGTGVKTLSAFTTQLAGNLVLGGSVSVTMVTPMIIGGDVSIGSGAGLDAASFHHAIAGNWDNQGTFVSTGSIEFNGAGQNISGATTFESLVLGGSGTKFFLSPITITETLSIGSGVVLSLQGIVTHQAQRLVLGGNLQASTGTWGGVGSGATNIDGTYFSADGGWITIATGGAMFYSRISGDWNTPGTWSNAGFGGAAATSVPAATDYVIIGNGHSVSLTAAGTCGNLSFSDLAGFTNTLTIGTGGALVVTESIALPQVSTSGTNNILVTAGSLQAPTLDFTATVSGAGHRLEIGTGNVTIAGNITGASTASTIAFTGAGFLTVGGSLFSAAEGTLTTVAGSTVIYNGASSQTVEAHTYSNLTISGAGNKTMAGTTLLVNGNLVVDAGADLIVPGVNLTVAGTTTVNGGVTFATSNAGAKTFVGLVSVNGAWSNLINESFVIRGGITNAGTFAAGNGTYTFNTNSQVLTGDFVMNRVTITGAAVVLTNTNTLTVNTALAGTGRLTQASGAVLNVNGTSTVTNLTATAAGNIVNYSGAANQTLKGVPYFHLYLSGGGVKTFQAGTTLISGDLILSGTITTASIPSITIGGNLDIGSGTTLTAPASIQLAGNFSDAGSFVHNNGTLLLNGAGDQLISGAAITDFYNLSIADAAASKTVSVNTSKNLINVLTLGENVIFDADGSGSAVFSLKSLSGTDTQDGTIGPIPASSSVTGAVRIERRMSAEASTWRYISSAAQGVNLSQFTDDMQAIRQSIRWYKEDLINTVGTSRWRGLASSTEVLAPGRGYQVYMYNNVQLDWDVTGPVNQGPFTWSTGNGRLSSSTGTTFTDDDKWNLIGNPYPSSIRWDGDPANWTLTTNEVASTIYVSDESGLGTLAYNYVDGSGDDGSGSSFPVLQDGVIATGQSFWVYVLPGASITIQESAKVPSNQNAGYEFYRKPAGAPVALNQLTIRMGQNGVRDEAYFKLNELATRELDLKWDAPKFFNEHMNIYFVDDANQPMGMHTLPDIKDDREIRLGYKVSAPGTYTFTAAFKGNMDELKDWYFLDRETQEKVRLVDLNAVEVTIADGKLADSNRFSLVKSQGSEAAIRLYPNPASDVLNVFAPSVINNIEIVDLQGNRMVAKHGFSDEFSASIDVLELKPGLYILKVYTQAGAWSEKFVKK